MKSIVESFNLSSTSEFVPYVQAEAFCPVPLNGEPPRFLTLSGRRSLTKLVQAYSDRTDEHIERIASIILKRDCIAPFLYNAKKRMHEIEQKLQTVKVERQTLIETIECQVAQIRNVKKEKKRQ